MASLAIANNRLTRLPTRRVLSLYFGPPNIEIYSKYRNMIYVKWFFDVYLGISSSLLLKIIMNMSSQGDPIPILPTRIPEKSFIGDNRASMCSLFAERSLERLLTLSPTCRGHIKGRKPFAESTFSGIKSASCTGTWIVFRGIFLTPSAVKADKSVGGFGMPNLLTSTLLAELVTIASARSERTVKTRKEFIFVYSFPVMNDE